MDWTANVAVHESASPDFLREEISGALKDGRVHPHLLYSGMRQTALWVALHRAYSPAQRDERCRALYQGVFRRAIEQVRGNVLHVVSLACGDGSKDLQCLQELREGSRTGIYTPVDISLEMVLTAHRTSAKALRGLQSTPLLCDLARCSVLPAILKGFDPSGAERLILFLGTIHNYSPPEIVRSILYPLRSQDQLLISANLVGVPDYQVGLESARAQYDNEPTRAWLLGALSELGLTDEDGELSFSIVESETVATLKRIQAFFALNRSRKIVLFGEEMDLAQGTKLSVFFSYRFTLGQVRAFLQP
ncbi:MAG TPA: L-histidine N(alpha)-methyltransferase, partial [Verrucomicrobiae bacterium]|nr:L-histidine N(alpha)-methyltransferase [Verrucomicrobiae bacterium]